MIKNKTFRSFDGSKIHYSIIGTGKKKVFLLHGLLQDRLPWVPFCLPLMKKYTFVLMESRGMGFSENKSVLSENVLKDISRDLDILSKKVLSKDEKAVLASVSMGNASAWYLKSVAGDDWVEKYICVDHALLVQVEGVEESKIFTKKYDEFYIRGKFVHEYIKENTEYCKTLTMMQLSEEIRNKLIQAHKYAAIDSAISSPRFRIFIDAFPDLSNSIAMFFTKLNTTWVGQTIAGAVYHREENRDFRNLVKSIDKPMIFFCGKINKAFDYDWQIKLIKENKPESKVFTFEKSGHDLMFAEPIKFLKCFKEALEF